MIRIQLYLIYRSSIMKKIIRILSLLLIFTMLLPFAVACSDEPLPPDNGEENGNNQEQKNDKYIKSSFKEYKTLLLTDFASESFKSVKPTIR